jgi:hypothetical protein
MTVRVDSGGNHGDDADDTATLSAPLRDRIEPDERVRPSIQGTIAEALDEGIELLGQLRHLALAHPLQAERLHQTVHTPCGHPAHVALGHHLHQRPFSTASGCE